MLTYMTYSAELDIEADFSEVNLLEGANFSPEFLKLVSGGGLSYATLGLTSRSLRIPMRPFPPLPTGESHTKAPPK